MKRQPPPPAPICPYCQQPAILLLDSSEIHQGRDFGPLWLCRACQAWVGTHKKSRTHAPLGRLANAELRAARGPAHAAFDRLWQGKIRRDGCSRGEARGAAYKWLAAQLGIEGKSCHIGMMDIAECRRVVEICSAIGRKPATERAA